eukprot:SAG25_NODE_499_length_7388_cov_11.651393_8_plen_131_part_00
MPLQAAQELIRAKLQGRLATGPGGLRRAFALFDGAAGGGGGKRGLVTRDDFRHVLSETLGLEFAPRLFDQLMESFGVGEAGAPGIGFGAFAEGVMGSSTSESTSAAHGAVGEGDKYGNSMQALRECTRAG